MNLLSKFQPDPTVDETEAAIRKFSFSRNSQKTLLQCETDFSLLKQLLKDPNGQIVLPHVVNLLSKFQPDPTVNKAAAAVGSC